MKLSKAIKTATIFSVLALGVHGAAMANDKRHDQAGAGPGGGPHVRSIDPRPVGHGGGPHVKIFNGNTPAPHTRPKPVPRPRPGTSGSVSSGNSDPQPIGMLLPAIQKAR